MHAMLAPSQILLWILLTCLLAWTVTFIWLALRRVPDTRIDAVEMAIIEESPAPVEQIIPAPLARLATIDTVSPAIEITSAGERGLVNAAAE